MQYISWFKDLTIKDIPTVGGKNASLGEMYSKLTSKGLPVPNGFALTADAYWSFIKGNKLDKKIKEIIGSLNKNNHRHSGAPPRGGGKTLKALAIAGEKIRTLILNGEFSPELRDEIKAAYRELGGGDVAVRSSATAEDLPDASFAGQQESYLNVRGEADILNSCRKCIASLFTDRAISYREDKGFDHMAIALSVGVQQMVRSDLGASGVMFTLDTESGFNGVVLINASYGLGEYVVKGRVTPDQFYVFKEGVKQGFKSIIDKRLGSKEVKLIYGTTGTKQQSVKAIDRNRFCLTDDEILQLAKWGMQIEEHYGHPMDIEWAKDGKSGQVFIVQARSETVKSRAISNVLETYRLAKRGKIIAEGTSVGQKIGQGKVRIIDSPKQMKQFKAGEVLVTKITDPDWEPIMRVASAIVTEQGGKTSHAAIVSRELGVPCVVGAAKARKLVKNGQEVTVSCAEGEVGYIYAGRLPFEVEKIEVKELAPTRTKIMMNVADPDKAFSLAHLPNNGVGLAREEFIFTNFIKIHPLALVNYKTMPRAVKEKINALTVGYKNKTDYLIDRLAEGIAFIAAAFSPGDVILRFSDFKTNEYATLIGGKDFEPHEENPMIGWRGASRYYDPKFKPAFALECAAIKRVREVWGLTNVIVMIPFCRTVEEGKKVLATMKEFGLERGKDNLQVYVMCEIPSNVLLAKEFSEIFDGFSIGSNDLTQLALGVDRDSALVAHVYDEKNAAVKKLIREVIKVAHENKRKVGICGQAPSDYPEFAEFLVQEGIDSISLNPDTVYKTRLRIVDMEKKLGIKPSPRGVETLRATSLQAIGVKSVTISTAKTLSKIASRAVTTLGVLALCATLLGVTCSSQESEARLKSEKESYAAQAVLDAKLELMQELKKQQAAERVSYSQDNKLKFSLEYPASWKIDNSDQVLRFSSPNNSSWLMIGEPGFGHPVALDKVTTTTFFGYDARRFTDASLKDGTPYEVLEVYPNGRKHPERVIEISGDPKYFAEFLASIQGFEIKK